MEIINNIKNYSNKKNYEINNDTVKNLFINLVFISSYQLSLTELDSNSNHVMTIAGSNKINKSSILFISNDTLKLLVNIKIMYSIFKKVCGILHKIRITISLLIKVCLCKMHIIFFFFMR